jgi:hypothetical protein
MRTRKTPEKRSTGDSGAITGHCRGEVRGPFADAFEPFARIAVLESENERLRELLSEALPHLPQRFANSLGCRVCEMCDQGKTSSRQAQENFVERQS